MKKIFVLGILASVIFAGCTSKTPEQNLDTFAQCLNNQGAIMYGSPTCPHCQKQKDMFAESFTYINYVDCTQEFERCADLKGVPTWKFSDGSTIEGVQSLETLAQKTDCTF